MQLGPARPVAMVAPVSVDVRLPLLRPKTTSRLQFLAAGGGSLFAAPCASGALLQWGDPEGQIGMPRYEQP